jgi:hypothetical protein
MEVSLLPASIFNIREGYTQRNAVSLLLRRMNYARTARAEPGRSRSTQFPEFLEPAATNQELQNAS